MGNYNGILKKWKKCAQQSKAFSCDKQTQTLQNGELHVQEIPGNATPNKKLFEIILKSEDLLLITMKEFSEMHPKEVEKLNQMSTVNQTIQNLKIPRPSIAAMNLVQLCVRLYQDTKIRLQYRTEMVVLLIRYVMEHLEDLEYTRHVSVLVHSICVDNAQDNERQCLLPILHELLSNPDAEVLLNALKGLACLCSVVVRENVTKVQDVVDSGICKLLPELIEKNDDEVKCLVCDVIAAITDIRTGVKLIYEIGILSKFVPLFASTDEKVRERVSNAVCEICRYLDLDAQPFINAGLVPVLWKATVDTNATVRADNIYSVGALFSIFNSEHNLLLIAKGQEVLGGKNNLPLFEILDKVQLRLDDKEKRKLLTLNAY